MIENDKQKNMLFFGIQISDPNNLKIAMYTKIINTQKKTYSTDFTSLSF